MENNNVEVGYKITVLNFKDQGLPEELQEIQNKKGNLTVATVDKGNKLVSITVEEMRRYIIYDFEIVEVNIDISGSLHASVASRPHIKIPTRAVKIINI